MNGILSLGRLAAARQRELLRETFRSRVEHSGDCDHELRPRPTRHRADR